MNLLFRRTIILIMLAFCLAGCAGFGAEPLALRDNTVDLVWPSPPNTPRIRFLREITGPGQIMPNQGKLGKLWQLVTGEENVAIPFMTPYGVVFDGDSTLCVADSTAPGGHRY